MVIFGCDQVTYYRKHRSWWGRDNREAWRGEFKSPGNIFLSFSNENIPRNESLRSKGSEIEVVDMSVSQAADTVPKLVFLKLLAVISIAKFRFSRFPLETSGLIFLVFLLLFSDETIEITIWQQKFFLCMNLKRTSKVWISICSREMLERVASKSQDKKPFVCLVITLQVPNGTLDTDNEGPTKRKRSGSMFRFLALYSRDLSEYLCPSLYPYTSQNSFWAQLVGEGQLWGHGVSSGGEYWWLLQEMKLVVSRVDLKPYMRLL